MKKTLPPPIRLNPPLVGQGGPPASIVQAARSISNHACGPPQRAMPPHLVTPHGNVPGGLARPIQRSSSASSASSSSGGTGLRKIFSQQELDQADADVITAMRAYNTFKTRYDDSKSDQDKSGAEKLLKLVIEKTAPRNFEYINKGFPQAAAQIGAIFNHGPGHPYYVFPTTYGLPWDSYTAEPAHGEYCFAILNGKRNEVLVCRDGEGRGHTSITKSASVYYAGKAYFTHGQLTRWNNDTGHYQTLPRDKTQATVVPVDSFVSPLLPLSLFMPLKL